MTQAEGTQCGYNYEDEEDEMDSSDRRFVVDESEYFSQVSQVTQLSESSYPTSQVNDDERPIDGITLYRLYNIERDQRAPAKLKQYATTTLTKHQQEQESEDEELENEYEYEYYYSYDYSSEETLSSETL